jgi:hypothetical protein
VDRPQPDNDERRPKAPSPVHAAAKQLEHAQRTTGVLRRQRTLCVLPLASVEEAGDAIANACRGRAAAIKFLRDVVRYLEGPDS